MRPIVPSLCLPCVIALLCAFTLHAGVGGGSMVRTHVIGGVAVEAVTGMKILPGGDIAVCGYTNSGRTLTVPGLLSEAPGGQDAFVAVLSADLSVLKYWTYFGGRNDDKATALAVMPNGTIIVTGETATAGLAMSTGAFAQLHGGGIDGFIIKLSSDLDSLIFGTYIPGNKDEHPAAVLVDQTGSVYVCGSTNSPFGFRTTGGYDQSHNGGMDAFVLKISPNGSALAFSTYFGGDGDDAFRAMTLTGDGGLAMTGYTSSSNYECFPIPTQWGWGQKDRPYDRTFNGGSTDAVLTIMSPDGARLITSTFFGGGEDEVGNVIVADVRGDLFLAGASSSPDLPMVSGLQQNLRGGSDGFMAMFDAGGMSLQSSSFLGGSGNDAILQAVSTANNVWTLLGSTSSHDLSASGSGSSGDLAGANGLFLARASISSISFLTMLGWTGSEIGAALVEDSRGDAYIAGATDAATISWSGGDIIENAGPPGTTEGFVTKWAYGTLDLVTPRGGERVCAGQNFSVTWATLDLGSQEEFELQISSDGTAWTSVASKLRNRSLTWKVPLTLVRGTQYLLRILSAHGHISEASGTFVLREPLSVVSGPIAHHVCAGADVVLNVTAVGEGITYQWKRDGVDVANATFPQLTLQDITVSKAGLYEVVVSSACGSDTTAPVLIQVDGLVAITSQPSDQTVFLGNALTLSVRSEGRAVLYEWRHNGQIVPNVTSTELYIPQVALTDAGQYQVLLAGSCGADTSRIAIVTVSTEPVSVQNNDAFAALGGFTFSLAPNPAEEFAHVTVTASSVLTVTDMRGRVVLTYNASDEATYPAKILFNLEPLATGSYVVSDGTSARLLNIIR